MGRLHLFGLGGISFALSVWAFAGCVGDEPAPPSVSNEAGPGTGAATGVACGADGECASGQCSDGVCCESACDGVCEACNLPGSLGRCAPVPAGEDPGNECKAEPRVDAGDAPQPVVDGGAADGGDAGASLNLPDAGLTTADTACAPKCNGNRACGFPDAKTTCGTTFCNSARELGRAACDGKGYCSELALDTCVGFACKETGGAAACATGCTANTDCLETHFCSGAGKCEPKKAKAVACTVGTECASGYCSTGVCCDTDCSGAGLDCKVAGKEGTCSCGSCSTGPCKLYYKDDDGDGFGKREGKISDGTAKYACADGSNVGAGWSDKNTDCYDVAGDVLSKSVYPGQTGYYATGYGPGNTNFDYDCNGVNTKETGEYVGGSCTYCTGAKTCSLIVPLCTKAGTQSYHACVSRFGSGCSGVDRQAFRSAVACGKPGTLYTCLTTCNGTAPAYDTTSGQVQRCR